MSTLPAAESSKDKFEKDIELKSDLPFDIRIEKDLGLSEAPLVSVPHSPKVDSDRLCRLLNLDVALDFVAEYGENDGSYLIQERRLNTPGGDPLGRHFFVYICQSDVHRLYRVVAEKTAEPEDLLMDITTLGRFDYYIEAVAEFTRIAIKLLK